MGKLIVQSLSKAYRVYSSHLARVGELVLPFVRRSEQRWVLKDLTFNVEPGEAVCVVGVNGAGKTTLLKLLAGITQPTSGSINISGRVAALLELGIGFHPEFTGRENVYMAGQLLGMTLGEIKSRMADIESFAEVGDYIDQPLRLYSSGMQMRLAFSVATVRRPDVLLVDEALSVGDAYFQHKSFERIRTFRNDGTTLFIVSHDRVAVQAICDRALLLNNGMLVSQGRPADVLDLYNALLSDREAKSVVQKKTDAGELSTISGSGQAKVEAIRLIDSSGRAVEVVSVGDSISLRVAVRMTTDVPGMVFGYLIRDRFGQPVYGTNTRLKGVALENFKSGERFELAFDFAANIGAGTYSITVALVDSKQEQLNFEWRDVAFVFNVVNFSKDQFVGCAWLDPVVKVDRLG
jgi:lipopolysaccharide transport system ATP-binding protein